MSGAVLWAGQPPRIEEAGGVFVLTLESGDETFRFAMPPHAARRLCEMGIRTLDAWDGERREVVPFKSGKRK